MNPRDADNLAVRVRREAAGAVRVKRGRTNGRECLHIAALDQPKSSTTIYSEAAWALHPLNRSNRPTKAAKARSEAQDAAEAVLAGDPGVELVNAALSASFGDDD